MKKLLSLMLLGTMLFVITSTACAAKYDWRFAIEEVPGSVQDLYAQEFAKRISENSNGQISLVIYPIGQLGNAKEIFELVQMGAIEFACLSPGNTGGMVPENQIFSLQFFFSDDMRANQSVMHDSEALNILRDVYRQKDIEVLSFWPEGFQMWTSNKPLRMPVDFEGFKMRVMPSPMLVAGYKAYGANPTPVPFMEVYSGLQLKMIDGQENPIFAIQEMKYMEIQKYLTLSKNGVFFTTTACNPMFLASLPEDIQKIVRKTVEEMQSYAFKMQEKLNLDRLAQIKEETKNEFIVEELTPEARQAFREKAVNSYSKYLELCNNSKESQEILKKLDQEIKDAEKTLKD